jgi:uncharacterized protein DUF4397
MKPAIRRVLLLALLPLLLLALMAAPASASAPGTGWVRLAHLSPGTPAVDVYLYPFGSPSAMLVLHHVAYGTVSPYQALAAGDYSVAMRLSGAMPSTRPVLSAAVDVAAGHAYTVAGLGPESGVRLAVLDDSLTAPHGKALVRVIQASLRQHEVTVTWGGHALAANLAFGAVSAYQAAAPGRAEIAVTSADVTATEAVTLAAGSVYTLVVLDGAKGLMTDVLTDAAGMSGTMPKGGVQTGLGGTAGHGPGSPLPWLAVVGAGMALALGGMLWRRRTTSPTARS